ncbi:phosphatase PAP2 family protein [Carnobacterium maltaromaticum]|uniref:phosphatase PAP2 family protein n=1 Tax=Carnobacterium maltaromaticum TaxID=2751 RepID=UPI0039BE529E
MNHYQKKWVFASLLALLGFGFVASSVMLKATWVLTFDQNLTTLIRDPITTGKSNFYLPITQFGSVKLIIFMGFIFCLFLIFRKKDWGNACWFVVNLAIGAGLLNLTMKNIFRRPRPIIEHLVNENTFSFPSGHAMGSMVFYFSVAFILYQFIRSNKLQIIVCLIASFMIVSIGMSRIYAGVHFPSDILGGYLLAFSWMALALAYYEKWSQWFQSKALQLLAK